MWSRETLPLLHGKRLAGKVAIHAIDTFSKEMERSRKDHLLRPLKRGQVEAVDPHTHSARAHDDATVLTATTTASRARSAARPRPMRSSASAPQFVVHDHGAPVIELMKLRELLNAGDSDQTALQQETQRERAATSTVSEFTQPVSRPRTATSHSKVLPHRNTPLPVRPSTGKLRPRVGFLSNAQYGGGSEDDEVRLPQRYDIEMIRSQLTEDLEWLQRNATRRTGNCGLIAFHR